MFALATELTQECIHYVLLAYITELVISLDCLPEHQGRVNRSKKVFRDSTLYQHIYRQATVDWGSPYSRDMSTFRAHVRNAKFL